MRLLIVTQTVDRTDPVLGFFHRWIEEFANHAERVTVIALRVGEYDLPENVTVHSLGKGEGVGRLTYLWRFFSFCWRYRRDYDAVFVHMNPEYIVLAGLLWRLLGKRIGLWYAHGTVNLWLRIATLFAHRIITSTPDGFRIESDKVRIVGQGIDTKRFRCLPARSKRPEHLRLIVVGRLSPIKHCEVAIEALARLRQRGRAATLTFVGDVAGSDGAAYRASLEQLVRIYDLADEVVFTGALPPEGVVAHLCEADIALNPSATGSLDKVGLEALAAGVPLLTSNEAFAGVLGAYRDRLMVPPDDADALAERIVALADAPDARQLTDACAARVRAAHGVEQLIPRIITAYAHAPQAHAAQFYAGPVDAKFGADYETARWHHDDEAEALYEMTRVSIATLLLERGLRYDSALELGPGAGTWTRLLVAHAPEASYDLVDISPNMLAKAESALGRERVRRVRYLTADFKDFTPDRTYDLFVSVRAFEYLASPDGALRTVAQLLAPHGTGFIVTKTPHYLRAALVGRRYAPLHRRQIAPETLARLARDAGFIDVELYPVTFTFPVFRSAYLHRLLFRIFGCRPLSAVSTFFSESYAVRFRTP